LAGTTDAQKFSTANSAKLFSLPIKIEMNNFFLYESLFSLFDIDDDKLVLSFISYKINSK